MNNTGFRHGLENFAGKGTETKKIYRVSGGIRSVETLSNLYTRLAGKRVAVLTHPAAVDAELTHSVERLVRWNESRPASRRFTLTALFGPQHGFAGERQDNMIESDDTYDANLGLPVFSLYGSTRRITREMAEHFDVLLYDLQDVGVRVYTFLTTLAYILSDFHTWNDKELVVLDRPVPTGRTVEGLLLESGWESFVGCASVPLQHGLTVGEFALWYVASQHLDTALNVVPMSAWVPDANEAWPDERVWIPPSPNMPGLHTARAYPGTVMLEGTTISEARGTTRPLSMFGHPDIDWKRVVEYMHDLSPAVFNGFALRPVVFEPTFHKHAQRAVPGFDMVVEKRHFDAARFRPVRFFAALFRAVVRIHPDLKLWSDPPYEYEHERLPIDLICGGPTFREWVESGESFQTLHERMHIEESRWIQTSSTAKIYGVPS
ncbi:MAG: DUF1343 domain-containing protein [Spirochaetaceae bacterium]|nr:MAG: DUF1343 domain-containing protein [Spirochaetaceae bacterium]